MALDFSSTQHPNTGTMGGSLSKKVCGQWEDSGNGIRPVSHGRVSPVGPLPENPGKGDTKFLSLCSGPLTLDVRPLSPYQQQLFHTVQSLKTLGWTDLQIANHFNHTGWLTPRGYRWIAQSVFSLWKKHKQRLTRIGDKP